jgi:hypothetical protein
MFSHIFLDRRTCTVGVLFNRGSNRHFYCTARCVYRPVCFFVADTMLIKLLLHLESRNRHILWFIRQTPQNLLPWRTKQRKIFFIQLFCCKNISMPISSRTCSQCSSVNLCKLWKSELIAVKCKKNLECTCSLMNSPMLENLWSVNIFYRIFSVVRAKIIIFAAQYLEFIILKNYFRVFRLISSPLNLFILFSGPIFSRQNEPLIYLIFA